MLRGLFSEFYGNRHVRNLISSKPHDNIGVTGLKDPNERFLMFSAVSLTCYTCYSKVNWTDCDQQRSRVICAPWLDVCAKTRVYFDARGKQFDVYERGCFANDFCTPRACKYISGGENCTVNCCDLELCNGTVLTTHTGKFLVWLSVSFAVFQQVLLD